ncbi:hypothetical protein MLD38_012436 [Melastoma candidum]|uniref:Uncharacterized protein n=1 Tax=Melastoma candidum TaxID=119954 RepID=A0ACB9R6C5_9MYRT|nr:hypothetical protein MLD38_012436 [Melastoma candidum]
MPPPSRAYAFGRPDEATHPDSMRATLAEFLSTFIFVFVGEGSILALGMRIVYMHVSGGRCMAHYGREKVGKSVLLIFNFVFHW